MGILWNKINEKEFRRTIEEATYDILQAYTQKELLEVHRQAKRKLVVRRLVVRRRLVTKRRLVARRRKTSLMILII